MFKNYMRALGHAEAALGILHVASPFHQLLAQLAQL